MAHARQRLSLFLSLAALFALDASAVAATRAVSVGPGLTHTFVDAVSGTSTSTITVGDTVQWTWSSGLHSTTSGPCGPTTCTSDGLWDSGVHSTPFSFSHTATFASIGTYHYHCAVHGATMQGDIVVVAPGPAPTVTAIGPTSGPADSGTAVVVTGTNFVSGATAAIGGVAATGVVVQDAATIQATTPAPLSPGSLNDVAVTNPDAQSGSLVKGWFADFTDVAAGDPFHDYVEKLVRNGVTAGCGSGNYCRNDSVTRAQMAVFLLKAKFGASHTPPACTGTVFDDVPCTGGAFDPWIEELAGLQVTGGCQVSPPLYCPGNTVNRQQMAVFLLKMKNGSAFVPPTCTGVFDDVPCTPGAGFSDWIEKLYADAVTGGCQAMPLLYCPTNPNTRGQMAVFLVKNFSLP